MKRIDQLGYFEQIYIRTKARKDAINQSFKYIKPRENMNQLMKYDEIGSVPIDIHVKVNIIMRCIRFFKRVGKDIHSNNTSRYEYVRVKEDDSHITETYFIISQYVLTEVARFVSKRDSSLSKDYTVIYLYNNKGKRKKKILRIGKALFLIDSQINEIKDKQRSINNSFLEKEKELTIKYEEAQNNNYIHKVKLYENSLQKLNEEKDEEINDLQLKINSLYSEKQRILKEKQFELLSIRSRIFLRIRYYYECANDVNPDIGIMLYNEDDLNHYTGLDFKVLNADCMKQLENIEE